jgi:hypothetical protein
MLSSEEVPRTNMLARHDAVLACIAYLLSLVVLPGGI